MFVKCTARTYIWLSVIETAFCMDVIWEVCTNISDEPASCIFTVHAYVSTQQSETISADIGTYLPDYMESHLRTPYV